MTLANPFVEVTFSGVSSVGRAAGLHPACRGFEPLTSDQTQTRALREQMPYPMAAVAQLV